MNVHLECISCYFRQGLQAAQFATDDPELWWLTQRNIAAYVQTLRPGMATHLVAEAVHRIIRESTQCPDPYREVKRKCNRIAENMLADARARAAAAADQLNAAVRFSIAGNVMDFGSAVFLDLDSAVNEVLEKPFAIDHRAAFFEAVERARTVLVLGDNTGEIVFDKLLLERLAPRRLFFAVRGAPILNDATPEDAREAGIHRLAEILNTGAAVPGIDFNRLPPVLSGLFETADIIIAKGQANFESLAEQNRENLFFLFTIKCPLVARYTGTSVGDIVLIQSGQFSPLPVK